MNDEKRGIKDKWKSLPTWSKVVLILFTLYSVGIIMQGSKPDACGCIELLEIKSSNSDIVPLSNADYEKWKKCYSAYSGPATATLKCEGR
jgi:hypothetical protein